MYYLLTASSTALYALINCYVYFVAVVTVVNVGDFCCRYLTTDWRDVHDRTSRNLSVRILGYHL